MEVVDLVELESVRSDELEKAKAVAGSHAPTTEVVSMFEMFEALLGWDEHDHALRTSMCFGDGGECDKRSLYTTSSQGNTRGHMNASQPRGTPSADKLNGDAVRARCISDGTVARYRSYINGIPKWVMTNKNIFNPQRFFDASGDLDPRRFTPKDFESFLVDKRETLKAATTP
ncbi:hypothetical protein PC111_g6574 [Phytophthora cactorum]|nr:hypothetical protein PC111_g6574 [Phytophthora cactorum]